MGLLATTHQTGLIPVAPVAVYRITRTIRSGQFADDACVFAWLKNNEPAVKIVDSFPEDENANRIYYLWRQTAEVPLPTACQLTLVTKDGQNGWQSEADARAVLQSSADLAKTVDKTVDKSKSDALNPLNWFDDADDKKPSEWGWVKWVLGGAVVVGGIYSVAKLVRG